MIRTVLDPGVNSASATPSLGQCKDKLPNLSEPVSSSVHLLLQCSLFSFLFGGGGSYNITKTQLSIIVHKISGPEQIHVPLITAPTLTRNINFGKLLLISLPPFLILSSRHDRPATQSLGRKHQIIDISYTRPVTQKLLKVYDDREGEDENADAMILYLDEHCDMLCRKYCVLCFTLLFSLTEKSLCFYCALILLYHLHMR